MFSVANYSFCDVKLMSMTIEDMLAVKVGIGTVLGCSLACDGVDNPVRVGRSWGVLQG